MTDQTTLGVIGGEDIVERLRREGRVYTHMEAADVIERLRAELAEAEAALEKLING